MAHFHRLSNKPKVNKRLFAKESTVADYPFSSIIQRLSKRTMNKYLDGSWNEFEQWIRFTIGSDFLWRVRPLDRQSNRQMVADQVLYDIKRNKGVFPASNSYIERKQPAGGKA